MKKSTFLKGKHLKNLLEGVDNAGQRRAIIRQMARQWMVSERTAYSYLERVRSGKKDR